MKLTLLWLTLALAAVADGPGVIQCRNLKADVPLTLDLASPLWKDAAPVHATKGRFGEDVPGHSMEMRLRWSEKYLYVLYVCPYQKLFLKPNPNPKSETNGLWDFDVAELFIGTDKQNPRRYYEFEISPQGEWVDLDIDRDHLDAKSGIKWDSGFDVKCTIDAKKQVWYGAMKIPFASMKVANPAKGDAFRLNLYRIQDGPGPNRKYVAWQPTQSPSFHSPDAFGKMVLE
jgi:hypothetical protein